MYLVGEGVYAKFGNYVKTIYSVSFTLNVSMQGIKIKKDNNGSFQVETAL